MRLLLGLGVLHLRGRARRGARGFLPLPPVQRWLAKVRRREVNEAETSLFLAEVERLMDAKGVVD